MTGTFDDGRAYQVFLCCLPPPNPGVQPLEMTIGEFRGYGWTGSAHVRPPSLGTSNSLQSILGTGLTPGAACVVHLKEAGTETVVRTWPSIVTSVNVKESTTRPEPFCVVTFCDPLTALSNRQVWFAWSAVRSDEADADGRTVLAEIIGGALSAAAGEDPFPCSTPALPAGYPMVSIDADVDDAVASPAYVVATGQMFGAWVDQLCGHLGVRIELVGLPSGELRIHLTDKPPAQTNLNYRGPVTITADSTSPPSFGNIQLSRFGVTPTPRARGGVLDTPISGGPVNFGPSGAIGSVISDARLDAEEAERRSGFGIESDQLETIRIAGLSSQPDFTIGRLVSISGPDLASEDVELGGQPGALNLDGEQWQVASVVHLYMRGSYWNRPEFEKAEFAWRPRLWSVPRSVVVSGWVDDGESDPGQPVNRDELGRLPVRPVFSQPVSQFTDESAAASYYPALKLSPVSLSAGDSHGYVADQRQQDWCRIQVHTPLLAEVIGFVYRDDRTIKKSVRDITAGMLVRQGAEAWRGWIFRPSSADEDDTAQTEDDTAQTEDDTAENEDDTAENEYKFVQTGGKPVKPFTQPNRGPFRKPDPATSADEDDTAQTEDDTAQNEYKFVQTGGKPVKPFTQPNRGPFRKPDPATSADEDDTAQTEDDTAQNEYKFVQTGGKPVKPFTQPNRGPFRKPDPATSADENDTSQSEDDCPERYSLGANR